MKYIAIFELPDDQVIYKGRPAILLSHSEDSEVVAMTVAKEVYPDRNEEE